MKKGFVLLETVIAITFLSIALIFLYSGFSNMVRSSKRNILYDDVANIYKTYYIKEYLRVNDFAGILDNKDIEVIDCNELNIKSCNKLFNTFSASKIYIAKYDLKEYSKSNYSSNFNNYLTTLSNKDNYQYRFIVEYLNNDVYEYASIGFNGEVYE